MGQLILFPQARVGPSKFSTYPADVLILPVIRVERRIDPFVEACGVMTTAFMDLNEILWRWP